MNHEQLIDILYSIVDDHKNLLNGDQIDAINEAIGRIEAVEADHNNAAFRTTDGE